MSNFADMQARIAREVRFASSAAASGIQNEIKLAINDAIEEYDQNRFEFNEGLWEADTVAGQWIYPVPVEFLYIDTFRITLGVGGSHAMLVKQPWNYLDTIDTSPGNAGYPTYYAIFSEKFRLYPHPMSVFPMRLAGITKLTPYPLVNDTDESAWTNQAERLIRRRAKAILYEDVLDSSEKAARHNANAAGELTELTDHAAGFVSTRTIQPSW